MQCVVADSKVVSADDCYVIGFRGMGYYLLSASNCGDDLHKSSSRESLLWPRRPGRLDRQPCHNPKGQFGSQIITYGILQPDNI